MDPSPHFSAKGLRHASRSRFMAVAPLSEARLREEDFNFRVSKDTSQGLERSISETLKLPEMILSENAMVMLNNLLIM